MRYTNQQMESMVDALQPMLERRDVIGYAAARNSRILRTELTEYYGVRDELVEKYGEEETDEDGNATGHVSLSFESPNFPKFVEEIGRYSTISHEPEIYMLKYDDVIGKLTGAEILSIDWMLED